MIYNKNDLCLLIFHQFQGENKSNNAANQFFIQLHLLLSKGKMIKVHFQEGMETLETGRLVLLALMRPTQ